MTEQDIERYEIQNQAITESELEAKPTEAGVDAATQAIADIRGRSFSGRHPELGKMIKCQVCGRRHRAVETHEQKFATGKHDIRDPKLLMIAGETPETETVIESRKIRKIFGASMFKGKRKKPPLNKRTNELVQLAKSFVPMEYTREQINKAVSKAKRILVKKYGRFGYMSAKWRNKKEAQKHVSETN